MNKAYFIALAMAGFFTMQGQTSPALIPYPTHLEAGNGQLKIGAKTLTYHFEKSDWKNAEQRLTKLFGAENKKIKSAKKPELVFTYDAEIPKEGYELMIGDQIKIAASTDAGAVYALQTLQQLYLLSDHGQKALPKLHIKDAPAFSWRGAELDVARHFFSKEYLLKFIDLLSSYKFNKLHLHLSDDQGWRLEIKKYPKLTENGAWRTFNDHDKECFAKAKDNPDFNLPKEFIRTKNGKEEYGGFYTQNEMREIIAYAQARNIEIIPEIDMPGHMMIATQNYPELLLDGQTSGWGKVFSVPINPCQESSYTFLKNVLTEVMDLFPSKYMHIGADEVEKTTWEKSQRCQELMKKENIKDMNALQSHFVNKMNDFIHAKGKKAIGWDEILDGGANPNMTVMYWRGWEKNAPEKAVTNHHQLIMTPNNPLYFDYPQNSSTLESVYQLKVVPTDIPADKKNLVLGAQGNIWTEMIPSEQRLEFMILPRLTALAERVWTDQNLFSSYKQRVISHYKLWDAQHYSYRLPDLSGFTDNQVLVNGKSVLAVDNPLPYGKVHYTTDGSVPSLTSKVLVSPMTISQPGTLKFATFSPSGAKSELYQVDFKDGVWHNAAQVSNLQPGLKVDFYAAFFKTTKEITGEVVKQDVLPNVSLSDAIKTPSFGAKFSGWIKIPQKGVYNFYLTCDDGGILKIADELVVDNDGLHSAQMKSGQVALEAGLHPLQVDFIEGGGGYTLKLTYSVNGSAPQEIPNEWLMH